MSDVIETKGKKPTRVSRFTKEQEVEMFKALSHNSLAKVASDFGLNDMYSSKRSAMAAVASIASKIKKNPVIYGLSEDDVDVVKKSIATRTLNPELVKSELTLQAEVFRDKLDDIRDMTADILQRKLKKIKKDKDGDASFRDLKELLSMAIDKGRLLKGESTEQVIHMSKIDVEGMSSKDALTMVLKARDALLDTK